MEVRRTAAGNSFPFVQLYGGFYGIFKHLGCCVWFGGGVAVVARRPHAGAGLVSAGVCTPGWPHYRLQTTLRPTATLSTT